MKIKMFNYVFLFINLINFNLFSMENMNELDEHLYRAIKKNANIETTIERLLTLGANPNLAMDFGKNYTVLLYLCKEHKSIEKIKLFLKFGADPNITNYTYLNCLYWACYRGSAELVKLLVDNGAVINPKIYRFEPTPAFEAYNRYDSPNGYNADYLEIIKLLIQNGLDINYKNRDGNTLLHFIISCRYHNLEFMKFLFDLPNINIFLKNKQNINILEAIKDKCESREKTHGQKCSTIEEIKNLIINKIQKIENSKRELYDAINRLDVNRFKEIAQNVSLGLYFEKQNNPLHIAILACEKTQEKLENKLKIIKLILKTRIDLINQKNKQELTPIELAISTGNHKILKLLIEFAFSEEKKKNNNKRDRDFDEQAEQITKKLKEK